MLRSALSAFTRVFDALWRCAADPGSTYFAVSLWVPAQLHRVRDTKRRRQLSRFTAALQHRSDQAEKVVIYEAVGLRQRFDRALFLASVGHDADEFFLASRSCAGMFARSTGRRPDKPCAPGAKSEVNFRPRSNTGAAVESRKPWKRRWNCRLCT
jgi:hypothetical protein